MQLCCLKCTGILSKTRLGDIEVDYCKECGGLWLDRGELERIVRTTRKTPKVVNVLRRKLMPLPTASPIPSDLDATCPVCAETTMREVLLEDVHVDYCTRCSGVFLDKGELDTALAKVQSPGTRLSVLIAVAEEQIPKH